MRNNIYHVLLWFGNQPLRSQPPATSA